MDTSAGACTPIDDLGLCAYPIREETGRAALEERLRLLPAAEAAAEAADAAARLLHHLGPRAHVDQHADSDGTAQQYPQPAQQYAEMSLTRFAHADAYSSIVLHTCQRQSWL